MVRRIDPTRRTGSIRVASHRISSNTLRTVGKRCFVLTPIMLANLWDLVDGGLDRTLDAIQSLGACELSVVVASGPITQLRLDTECDPRVFCDGGGLYFKTDPAHYDDARVKPILSPWLRQRNPLDEIADAADKRGLPLRLRVSAFSIGQLAQRHPEIASKCVYGDASGVRLCPAHPDVRALLRCVVSDLSERYVPAAIELDDFDFRSGLSQRWSLGYSSAAVYPACRGAGFDQLAEICFAEASRQWAIEHGADPASASRWVKVQLERAMQQNAPIDQPLETLLANAPLTRDYLAAQSLALDTLLENLVAQAGQTPLVLVSLANGSMGAQPSDRGVEIVAQNTFAADCAKMDSSIDRIAKSAARSSPASDTKTIVQIAADQCCARSPQELVRVTRRIADAGLSGVTFCHWSAMGEQTRDAVRQAIRFTARTTV